MLPTGHQVKLTSMKLAPFLFLLFIALPSCHSDKAIKPVDLSGCNDMKYTRAKQLNDVATFIIAKTRASVTGSSFTDYYLDQPDSFAIPWVACNLPEAYKKDHLAVRINGYTLTYPGMEKDNSIGNPIELTRIEVR